MSDTPRTDAFLAGCQDWQDKHWVEFAREMERRSIWLTKGSCIAEVTNHEKTLTEFRNFHRRLCERFGYAHDEADWRRDLCSLEEHIARKIR